MSAACWICGGAAVPYATLAPLPFARCEACGFVFRPDVDAAEVRDVYVGGAYEDIRGEHYISDSETEARRSNARVRLDWLGSVKAPGRRLLDVGAAGGAFVAEALRRGYEARGIEPTPAFARHAREALLVDVEEVTLEGASLTPETLDVITMWHVLEHVREPLGQLVRLREALSEQGVLAIEVPNYGSAVAARMGADWPSLEPGVHVSQFAPETVRRLLERAGFDVLDVHTVPITPYLPAAARVDPRHLAGRAKAAVWLRSAATVHPTGHELLRAIARRPRAR